MINSAKNPSRSTRSICGIRLGADSSPVVGKRFFLRPIQSNCQQASRSTTISVPRHNNRLLEKEIAVHQGHEFGMWLRKAYLSFHRRANALMLNHGVTADQFVLLSVVAREPGITQITIVERTASDPNTVAAILRLLEVRRLVRREVHVRDGRARCVFLTAEGRRVQQRAAKTAEPILSALVDCIGSSERSEIERFLQRVHQLFSAPLARSNGQPSDGPSKRKRTT